MMSHPDKCGDLVLYIESRVKTAQLLEKTAQLGRQDSTVRYDKTQLCLRQNPK